jgi:hypothetical protein
MADPVEQSLMVASLEEEPSVRDINPDASQKGAEELNSSAIATAAQFLRTYWARVCVFSALVLVPCFWHRRIEAGDLASHTYNAWLAQLIEQGQAPGLWLARQWNNILFDILLVRLGSVVGLDLAEKIAVSVAVLVFFWGAFTLVAAMTRRIPWFLVPCIMIFAYGWTFQMGFLNYYISLGLAFFGMALAANGSGWQLSMLLVLVPLTWMAHPLGVALLVGGGAYLALAKRFARRGQWFLLGAAALSLAFISPYISTRYEVHSSSVSLYNYPHSFSGVDQLDLYGTWYTLLSNLLLVFILICLASDVFIRLKAREALTLYRVPSQIYVIAVLSSILLPRRIFFPQYPAPFDLLTERLTSVVAILGCCLLGVMTPKKWHLAGFVAFGAVFFFFLYQDTGKVNRMEVQAERYERVLPPGQRIIATIWPFPRSRVYFHHIVDRSCVGYCFSYGNYEPSSQQFRVRANPGNRIVTASGETADAIESGEYVVQPGDLPIFQIYQCDLNMTELCMRELAPGEKNGSVGLHPVQNNR